MSKNAYYFLLVFFLTFNQLSAHSSTNNSSLSKDRLKVYVDENELDFNYLREAIDFADFVNDPATAHVHILIVEEQNGSGGSKYSIWFNSRKVESISDYTLSVSVIANETQHNIRTKITETIIKGLLPFVNEIPNGEEYQLTYKKINSEEALQPADKWNNWVFKLTSSGGIEYEENRSGYDYSLYLKADKVTEKIKINNYIYLDNEVISYKGVDYEYRYSYKYAFSKVVWSLSDHWSTGLTVYGYQSTYHNTNLSLAAMQAFEYNVFPWKESNKRFLTVAYAVGYQSLGFFEKNYRGNMNERSPLHRLYVEGGTIQPWGEISLDITGSQYLNDLSLYNLSFGADFSFRIVKGLSLTVSLLAESIHDQVYIPESVYSLEEVISGALKLPSTYELGASLGITYQFGSIYNNIVNRRL